MSIRLKEAIKTALAMVLVYGIALSVGWMNPYWAGWAVAMVSLSTAGESLHKGVLRLAGTVPGCAAALLILSLAPQSRWVFIALLSGWIFLTSYMMNTDTRRRYFWQVAGFVCPIIVITGPASSEVAFEHAMFRTVETTMGVAVYMLVTLFLWPRSNAGATRKASGDLVASQAALLAKVQRAMTEGEAEGDLDGLYRDQAQKLAALEHALQSESAERYEVRERRVGWRRFETLCRDQQRALARLQTGAASEGVVDLGTALPNLDELFVELEGRFDTMQGLFEGEEVSAREAATVTLRVDPDALRSLGAFDSATVAATRDELQTLESLTRSSLACARALTSEERTSVASWDEDAAGDRRFALPVIDLDHLRGAAFAATSVFVAFLIWVFLNPPGHTAWFMLAGSLGLAVAGTQQMRTTEFVKPLLVALPLSMCVYVFVLPKLSSFVGLGLLIFVVMFVIRYFFTGLAAFCGTMAGLQGFVTNQQGYDFASVANSSLFTVMAFGFVFAMSYLLRSPRPEKAVLALVRRFFRSAEGLIAHSAATSGGSSSWFDRYRVAYWTHELETLPAKLQAWGRAINTELYPGTKPEQVQALVISLRVLAFRVLDLVGSGSVGQADLLANEIRKDAGAWRTAMIDTFAELAAHPETGAKEDAWHRFEAWVAEVDERAAGAVARLKERLTEADVERFYRRLGGPRGVSQALRAYASTASAVNWNEWREERFS